MFTVGQILRDEGVEYRISRAKRQYACIRCKEKIERGQVYARWVVRSWLYTADPLCLSCLLKLLQEFHPNLLCRVQGS
jgi:hypothetical protein